MSIGVPLAIYLMANGADYASTMHLRNRGGREAFLPTQSMTVVGAFQVGATAAETWGDAKLRKSGHGGWAWAARVAIVGLKGWAVAHNLREARRMR